MSLAMPLPRCFVIRPIDPRSEDVLDFYVRPACDSKFEVLAAGEDTGPTITENFMQALEGDPLAIAYLGRPIRGQGEDKRWYWNGNVMFEVGYRLGLKKPIVFLRDPKKSDDEPLLPFDLVDYRIVELPAEDTAVLRRTAVSKLKELIDSIVVEPPPEESVFACLTMEFDERGGRVTAANPDAAQLFRYESSDALIGMDVRVLIEKIRHMMPPSQRQRYQDEQEHLLSALFLGNRPKASVCLVLSDKTLEQGDTVPNAYLPIVTRFARRRGVTRLEVQYPSVRRQATLDAENVVRCFIGDDS